LIHLREKFLHVFGGGFKDPFQFFKHVVFPSAADTGGALDSDFWVRNRAGTLFYATRSCELQHLKVHPEIISVDLRGF